MMPKLVEVEHTEFHASDVTETKLRSKKIKQQLQEWKTAIETRVLFDLRRLITRKPEELENKRASQSDSNAATTQPKTAEELCEVCCTIDFDLFSGLVCEDHRPRYNLGFVEDIQQRKNCGMCRLVAGSFKAGGFGVPQNLRYICHLIPNDFDGHGVKVCLTAVGSEREPGERRGWQIIRKTIEHSKPEDELSFAPTSWVAAFGTYYGRRMESCQVDFDLIRGWLQSCETTHGDICMRPSLDPAKACSIRLIDVLNRRLVDGTTSERYVALSYVWGAGNQFCLSKENQGDLGCFHGIKDEDLPNTIKDAFKVVAGIGERYLWIDRLCILIDDETDKIDQMSKMDQIYSAAMVTLVSASACCADGDIAGVRPNTRQLVQHSEVIRDVHYITTQPDIITV